MQNSIYKKLVCILLFVGIAFHFHGCLDDSPVEVEDFINISLNPFDTLIPDEPKKITGTVSASNEFDNNGFSFELVDTNGNDMKSYFAISTTTFEAKKEVDLQIDLGLTITPSSKTPTGSYTFTLIVEIGSLIERENNTFFLNTDEISILLTPFDTITPGEEKAVEGTVHAFPPVDEKAFDFAVVDSNNNDVKDKFTISFNDIDPDTVIDLKNDLNLTITPSVDIPAGQYTFKISGTTGTDSASNLIPFIISGNDTLALTISPFDTLPAGITFSIEGIVAARPAIDDNSFSFSLFDSSGNNANDKFIIIYNVLSPDTLIDLKNDLGLYITPDSTIQTGKYAFTITVTGSSLEVSEVIPFMVVPGSDNYVIISLTPFDTLKAGVTFPVSGTVQASPAIDETAFSFYFNDPIGNVSTSFKTVVSNITPSQMIDLSAGLGLAIIPDSATPAGLYHFTMVAVAGTAASIDTNTFYIKNEIVNPELDTVTVTLGSWNSATYGSSFEADSLKGYKLVDAVPICAEIDIWYSNETDGSNVFYSTRMAAIAQHPPKDWLTQNETQMAVVQVDFNAIKYQTQVDSIWLTVPLADKKQLLRLNANDVLILQTNLANIRLIKFISGDGTNTGSAVIKGKK